MTIINKFYEIIKIQQYYFNINDLPRNIIPLNYSTLIKMYSKIKNRLITHIGIVTVIIV